MRPDEAAIRNALRALCVASLVAMAMPVARTHALNVTQTAAMPSDFNGDGHGDLAVGTPFESVGPATRSGAVNVLYGSASGLSASGNQLWSQNSAGIAGVSESSDELGTSLASADFNRDGYADLAIGAPGDRAPDQFDGAVNVVYGSATGLTASGNQRWTKDEIAGVSSFATLGSSLAAGDFDGDGYADVAIGGPGADVAGTGEAGIVAVLRGGPGGLSATGATTLTRAMTAGPGEPNQSWHFGSEMAAGDLDGDGRDDLAVEAPAGGTGGDVSAFYGSDLGLTEIASQLWSQDSPGIRGKAYDNDEFGAALDIGDFDGDGMGDLSIGVPGEDSACTPSCLSAGAVNVIYGSASGLTATGNQLWSEATAGVPGRAEKWDQLGAALAAGDFDGDGRDDLAVAAPGEDPSPHSRPFGSGSVYALYGSAAGLSATGVQRWTQDSAGVPGSSEPGDWFGESLATSDFGRSGRDDLAIGAPRENLHGVNHAGVVDVLYGRASGLGGINAQAWSQDAPGILGAAEHEYFGLTLLD